ncbi:MAG: glycosyltransferase family 2 protein [Chthoniobacterales bacterium]
MSLPVSIVIPTRNAMGVIEPHIAAVRECLAAAQEVIVVDSSEDGTLDYLRSELTGANIRFFERPRGLYESWNFATQQATAPYIYFSTMGDTIEPDGLRHLLDAIQSCGADVIISPPGMFNEAGEAIETRWPIHSLVENFSTREVRILPPVEAFLFSISCVPETVLGSSASNLYRREFLAAHPFPEGWGHCADSAWLTSHSLTARIAVTPQAVARFVVHAKESAGGFAPAVERTHFDDMFRRAGESLEQSDLPAPEREILQGWLTALRRRYQQFFDRLDMHVVYFARRDERIRAALERGDKFKARVASLEEEIHLTRGKLVDIRADMGAYERIHRSLPRMIALYFKVKMQQARKALAMLGGKSKTAGT